eukprot:2312320-Amphidinium_carterae.1
MECGSSPSENVPNCCTYCDGRYWLARVNIMRALLITITSISIGANLCMYKSQQQQQQQPQPQPAQHFD